MARFVYIGSDDGPAATHINYAGDARDAEDLRKTGRYEFERGGVAVEVPARLAARLSTNPHFAEESTPGAQAAALRRKAVEQAELAAIAARKKTEADILREAGGATPEKVVAAAESPAKPAVAEQPKPPAPTKQVTFDGGTHQNRAPQQGAQAPRSAGGRRKSLVE